MKKKWIKSVLLLILLATMPVLYFACGAASAPVPPAELPSPVVLKYVEPTNLRIDISAISPPANPSISMSKAINPGDDVSAIIQFGPFLINGLEEGWIIPALDGISQIDFPNTETTTTFEQDVDFPQNQPDEIRIFAGTRNVKISFADFDFDNDGNTEGCSGNSAILPVCARLWLDDVRFVAWVFDEEPNADQSVVGKGRFKFFVDDLGGLEQAFAIHYEQLAATPDTKGIEHFLMAVSNNTQDLTFLSDLQTWNWHLQIGQTGQAGSELKAINLNSFMGLLDTDTSATGFLDGDYIGAYQEGVDLWSGSVFRHIEDTGGAIIGPILEQNICANISSGLAVDVGLCDAQGISVGATAFVRDVTAADVAVPNDFPETPPAGLFP